MPTDIEEAKPASPPIVYRYKNADGDFVPGVPARDLNEEELAYLDAELIEGSGLYEKVVSLGG